MSRKPTVTLRTGKVQGSVHRSIHRFRGIPFAEPPVGDLRWRPPTPPRHWDGVRSATSFGPRPFQKGTDIVDFFEAMLGGMGVNPVKRYLLGLALRYVPRPRESEDCLYLNVCTPALPPDAALPVMVWFHGGDHQDGSGSELFYHANQLPEHGVVLVTVNYRLGLMGYLCHPELSAESDDGVSGNYGTLDQIAALDWVQQNIERFAGDPGNVTIFGQSAGGESVAHLLASPLANGLFHRAILQSPSNSAQMVHRTEPALRFRSAEQMGVDFATRLVGGVADQVPRLRALPADTLVRLARKESSRFLFFPTIDGHALPLSPFECFRRGLQHKVPIMVGSNSDEGSVVWPMMGTPLIHRRYEEIAPGDVGRLVRDEFGDDAPRLFALYPGLEDGTTEAQTRLLGDGMFGAKAYYYALQHARSGEAAYLYHFNQVLPLPRQTIGAFHIAEVPYVFGYDSPVIPLDKSAGLSETMSRYWSAFARQGAPADEGLPEWRSYEEQTDQWMSLGPDLGMRPVSKGEHYALLNKLLEAQLDSLPGPTTSTHQGR